MPGRVRARGIFIGIMRVFGSRLSNRATAGFPNPARPGTIQRDTLPCERGARIARAFARDTVAAGGRARGGMDMRQRTLGAVWVLALLMAWAGAAVAQEAPPAAGAPAGEALAKPAGAAVEESEQIIFERIMGFYLEGRVGTFFTVAGARGWSNAQPFFGFELGYDINDALSLQLSYASGYQAANPLKYVGGCDPSSGDCSKYCDPSSDASCNDYHMDFSLTFINLSADYDMWSGERFALEARLGGGIVIIQPSAKPDQPPVDGDAFVGVRYEYYTLLKHFTVGAEFDFYYIFSAGIPAFSGSVSVVYNF